MKWWGRKPGGGRSLIKYKLKRLFWSGEVQSANVVGQRELKKGRPRSEAFMLSEMKQFWIGCSVV